jgi:hypothetical protein
MNKFKKVILGAPSLTGKDANSVVSEAFKGLVYPAKIRFTNMIGMALSFPEVRGLFLEPIGHDGKESVVVEINDESAFQRLASSIEQIAELNGKEQLLSVEVYDEEAEALAQAEALANAEANDSGDDLGQGENDAKTGTEGTAAKDDKPAANNKKK